MVIIVNCYPPNNKVRLCMFNVISINVTYIVVFIFLFLSLFFVSSKYIGTHRIEVAIIIIIIIGYRHNQIV